MKQLSTLETPLFLSVTSKSLLLLFLISYLGLDTANAQIGIGTTSPDASAQLELQSTEKGFLPPRMDTDARDGIGSPAEGLTIYNTDNKCLEFFTSDNDWISACDGSVVTTPAPPTVIGANNVEWMDRNLGASQVAGSSTDAASRGDLYQWGRAADGHEKISRVTGDAQNSPFIGTNATTAAPNAGNSWDGYFITEVSVPNDWLASTDDNLWQGVNGTNNPCPAGFRLPTATEWETEIDSWASNDVAGGFASTLKLTLGGRRSRDNGSFSNNGSFGYYWSSTDFGNDSKGLILNSSKAEMENVNRAYGYSVRCLKD